MHIAQRFAIAVCCLVALLAGWEQAPSATTPAHNMTAQTDMTAAQLPAANPVLVTIDGAVRSDAGRAMPGIRLSIRPASSTRECLSCAGFVVRTDSAGRFSPTLARADYLIMCAFPDASPCRIEGRAGSAAFAVTSGSRELVLLATRAPATGKTVTVAPKGPRSPTSGTASPALVNLQLTGVRP